MTYSPAETPTKLEKVDDTHIAIHWADGVSHTFEMSVLRFKCPCAQCVEEWTGKILVRWEDCREVRLRRMEQMGSYAFSLNFSDGHETGIYPFKMLRRLGETPPVDPGSD